MHLQFLLGSRLLDGLYTRLRQQQQGCPVQKWNICLEMMMMMVVVLVKLEEARKGKM